MVVSNFIKPMGIVQRMLVKVVVGLVVKGNGISINHNVHKLCVLRIVGQKVTVLESA